MFFKVAIDKASLIISIPIELVMNQPVFSKVSLNLSGKVVNSFAS